MSTLRLRLRRATAGIACASMLAVGTASIAAPVGASPVLNPTYCPAAAGNARFVRYTYLWILQRCPDPAGMAYWTAQLDSGRARASITNLIDMSNENLVHNNVDGLYQEILNRAPSAVERAAGVAMIRSTRGDATLIATLASSDEYFAAASGANDAAKNTTVLTVLFKLILDRYADAGAVAYYTGLIGTPSTAAKRYKVLMLLEHSPENAGGWTAAAIGAAFGRAPDGAGIGYWSHWLLTTGHWQTFRMWTYVLASPEGYAFSQMQPVPDA